MIPPRLRAFVRSLLVNDETDPILSPPDVEPDAGEAEWSVDEIDRLYRQALEAVEAVSQDLDAATESISETLSADDEPFAEPPPSEAASPLSTIFDEPSAAGAEGEESVTTAQVIEALLFVGGEPLSAKRICNVLKRDFDPECVDEAVAMLNTRYAEQQRPYEVRLVEGGYRMALRAEFEPVRNRAFGLGPKDVRLANDLLEILAVVAYRQPIARGEIEAIGKRHAGSQLRQLLRRELIAVDRGEGGENRGGNDVAYRTTPRFLQLFGLARLNDLPRAEELESK